MTADTGAKMKVGILSLGDMGVGIARLLVARGFLVATNCKGRRSVCGASSCQRLSDASPSDDTVQRAREAGVETLSTDGDLVRQCAVILSVVPPRDAEATARRIADALAAAPGGEPGGGPRGQPVYYLDLNAVSPATGRGRLRRRRRWVDAAQRARLGPALAGGAARRRPAGVGAASGLKMCFAAVAKGFTALATQSFATAHRLGITGELRRELGLVMPRHLASTERGVPDMPPKAYRWVGEMEEIAATMNAEGRLARRHVPRCRGCLPGRGRR